MNILEEHIVKKDFENRHVEAFAFANVKCIPSKKGILKAIQRGQILIDNQKVHPKDKLVIGSILRVIQIDSIKIDRNFPILEILFEDSNVLVINKPAGIPVRGNRAMTIENIIQSQIELAQNIAYSKIRAVHRLDIGTSGILLMAKTHKAHLSLAKQFENRTIQKEYKCLVIGNIPSAGIIEHPIDGKEAISTYQKIRTYSSVKFGHLTQVIVKPKTGRSNQIRIHLSQFGYPILGDEKFGDGDLLLKGKGLFLHATSLLFHHPCDNQVIEIRLEPPRKFDSYPISQERYYLAQKGEK